VFISRAAWRIGCGKESSGAPVKQFLDLAISLCMIVDELHRRDVTHRQIQPRQIFQHPENGEITLFCFAFATTGDPDDFGAPTIPPIADLLAYASPELTGRMNRAVDYRTDFYSLGMTFYELLTGRLPFSSDDALEIVHWHIAGSAISPHDADGQIPFIISELVMKLLLKDAAQRYQSALTLRADLERCRRDWVSERRIVAFHLAQNDVTDHFLLPQKLYGREREMERMFSMFARAGNGEALVVLVGGYSGVGKTSFVQELYRPIIRQHGYFNSGKVNQVVRTVPFGALFRAFEELIDQLLAESEESQQEWKRLILSAVGPNAGVIAKAVPRVQYLIGEQESPLPIDPAERQNRFRLVFQALLNVFATAEHPLVILLDDLQWADIATLQLLYALFTHPESGYLLIIGAYRDNEVDATHPLARTFPLEDHREELTQLERLRLGPIDLVSLGQFIADTLHRDPEEIASLSRLVKEKTDGNPFLRLGKVNPWDAFFYIIAQFIGGVTGVFVVGLFIGQALAYPSVHYAVTAPGAAGDWVAFVAEFVIAFFLMLVVLLVNNTPGLARWTGIFAGGLVAIYITFEAPLSGMSMNPARTFGSAAAASFWAGLWSDQSVLYIAPSFTTTTTRAASLIAALGNSWAKNPNEIDFLASGANHFNNIWNC